MVLSKILGGCMISKYKGGFSVNGKHPIETVEWLFGDKESSDSKLVFLAYDANLCALPDFSNWNKTDWKQNQIEKALAVTSEFNGEVWLDDVQIK